MRLRSLFVPLLLAGLCVMPAFTGCAEGLFWRGGKYVPWARNQWAEEEQLADTLFVRKRQMDEMVINAENRPIDDQTAAASKLAQILDTESILLIRIHAVKLLGRLDCPASIEALEKASRDPNPDVRVEAARAWSRLPAETAIPRLQELIGADTNVDVRLAATRALSNFPGSRTVEALSLALDDPDPALQIRAAESLQAVTGEKLGRNVVAWQDYIKQSLPRRNNLERNPSQFARNPNGSQFD